MVLYFLYVKQTFICLNFIKISIHNNLFSSLPLVCIHLFIYRFFAYRGFYHKICTSYGIPMNTPPHRPYGLFLGHQCGVGTRLHVSDTRGGWYYSIYLTICLVGHVVWTP